MKITMRIQKIFISMKLFFLFIRCRGCVLWTHDVCCQLLYCRGSCSVRQVWLPFIRLSCQPGRAAGRLSHQVGYSHAAGDNLSRRCSRPFWKDQPTEIRARFSLLHLSAGISCHINQTATELVLSNIRQSKLTLLLYTDIVVCMI